jgi:hypothetical protein
MTRPPAGDDAPIEGGGAAERLRQFLQERAPDTVTDEDEAAKGDGTEMAVEDEVDLEPGC